MLEVIAAVARDGYLEEDALRSDGASTQTVSRTHFCMFWSFRCYKGRCEVDDFIVAFEGNCRKEIKDESDI